MIKRIFALLVALSMAISLFALALADSAAEVGKPAPDFELTTLEGESVKLSDLRGKVVYLNVFATWCPPCVYEIPDIQALAEAHPEELTVIGASVDQTEDVVREFVEQNGLTYAVAMDEGFRLAGVLFPTQGIPESVFIDPEGNVSSIVIGMLEPEEMERRFQLALEGGTEAE